MKPPILRKKDKRKQQKYGLLDELLTSVAPDVLVAEAIRVDELHRSASILEEPLESGRFHDVERFVEALLYLRCRNGRDLPSYALTPVIVSGLLSTSLRNKVADVVRNPSAAGATTIAIQQQPETSTTSETSMTLSPDLVLVCNSLRRAALYRLKCRNRRIHQLSVVASSIAVLFVALCLYRSRRYWQSQVESKDMLHSCDTMPAYYPACRLAEATVWWKLQLLEQEEVLRLHTTLERNLISWDEVKDAVQNGSMNRESSRDHRAKGALSSTTGSVVYAAVEDAIETHALGSFENQSILDIGCGVGELAHGLPRLREYHGISASGYESHVARQMSPKANDNVMFFQQSFDSPFPQNNYSVVVAVETLSFSRKLDSTLEHIVASMETGGVMVVVDDVLGPNAESMDEKTFSALSKYRASLVPHASWMVSLEAAGCKVVGARDLSLEYQIPMKRQVSFYTYNWRHLRVILSIAIATLSEQLYLSRHPQSLHLVELLRELMEVGVQSELRRSLYATSSDLSYFMYVCIKA